MTVYAVDPLPSRRALARRLEASTRYDPPACNVGQEIKQAGDDVDMAAAVSGNYWALQDAIRAVHNSDLVVTVSSYDGRGTTLQMIREGRLH